MDFVWRQRMIRQEEGRMFEERNSAIFYKYAGGGVDNLKETSSDSRRSTSLSNGWRLKPVLLHGFHRTQFVQQRGSAVYGTFCKR